LRVGRAGVTLTGRSITPHIARKGQVTIPQEIRNRLGLLPNTEVEFELAGDYARIRKTRRPHSADTRMSTDEILALTRAKPARPRDDASDTAYRRPAGTPDGCRGVLVDSSILLDAATNDPNWGLLLIWGLVLARTRRNR